MARNPNPYYWSYGIPAFNMAHKFVYMNDLMNTENNIFIARKAKEQLFSDASNAAASVAAEIGVNDGQIINSAIEFLRVTADHERAKELAIIKEYAKDLKQQLPRQNKKIDQLLNQVNANVLDNPDQLIDFYTNLTRYLNVARTGVVNYRKQLFGMKKHVKTTMSQLAKDDYRFRATGDVQALLNNVIGIATTAQQKKETSLSNYLRHAAKEYVMSSGLINNLQSGTDIAAAFAAVALDMEQKIQEKFNSSQYRGKKEDLVDLLENGVIQEVLEAYKQADEEHQSNLQKAIQENGTELENILSAAKTVLNIQLETRQNARVARDKQATNRSKRLSYDNSLYRQLKKEVDNSAIDELQYVTFSVGASNTAHGNVFELINVVTQGNTVKIQSNVGTDTIHLGSYNFDLQPSDIQASFMPILSKFNTILNKYDQQKRQSRLDDQTLVENELNEEIDALIKELDEYEKTLDIPLQNLFVYHESLKLYKGAETGESRSFHGRDLTIMNYLDKLYSANGLANLELPSRNALDFLVLNLSSLAVGGNLKGTVEEYLSIFAGMLMFDDVQNIAQEAMNMIQGAKDGTVKQIHLYNLNGVYVPASMLLSFTYAGMKELSNTIFRGYAARAAISTAKADSAISDYLTTRPTPLKAQWPVVAESVASGTTIRINFLASFNEFLKGLGV